MLSLALSAAWPQQVFAVDVNNFWISNYTIEMRLGRDETQRSTLQTTETITAEFPSFDQNHGIERAIPKSYDGHTTNVQVTAVTDEKGAARTYTTYDDSNGNLVVRMADMNTFVHGTQVYKLTYQQRDVTKYFADSDRDEFYWDTNGTDWRVPIQRLETTLIVDPALRAALTGTQACYKGAAGSTDTCTLNHENNRYTAVASGLGVGENVTIAVGFNAKTFSGYQMSTIEVLLWLWGTLQATIAFVSVGVGFWLIRKYMRLSNRDDEVGSIAPEYLPPQNASVTVSAQIVRSATGSVIAAQLVDFAVRHFIKLYELKPKKWYRAGEYEIEITNDPSQLRAEEQELLNDMFGHAPQVGERLNLKTLRNNTSYGRRLMDNDAKVGKAMKETYGLRHIDMAERKTFRKIALILLLISIALAGSLALFMCALLAFIFSFTLTPLTDDGLALRRYLDGLKLYIGVAETERLQMLQSPEGAEKVAAYTADGAKDNSLVKLYERVLPYAVLFGQEKQWTKQLGVYYEQANSQPDWYTGQAVFNAAVFSSALSGLSSAASYASSSSSGSSGSGGGGFSGGGGGGGGGGGV
ncbi:MAG TPA: DUF2207 domain-containing protein [Patescibacteria group bacterium]|jgi:uncharacterized membrane protein YgcG|nr:DUF2207 domain-containing protein [Patescibacteria group bacterium]